MGPNGQAAFHVYAVAQDAQYFHEITALLDPGPQPRCRFPGALRVKVRPAPGSRDVSGTWTYQTNGSQPLIVFTPKRKQNVDRSALITFSYRLDRPGQGFQSIFTLTIPAGVGSNSRQK